MVARNRRTTHISVLNYGTDSNWSEGLRDYIFDRDEGKCAYCGEQGIDIDHVLPYSKGGPTIRANGVVNCKRCNGAKSNRLSQETLTRGFYHLLSKGESISWLDDFFDKLPTMWGAISED